MIGFYTYIRSTLGLAKRRKLRFSVSPESGGRRRGSAPDGTRAAHRGYAIACFIGGMVRLLLTHTSMSSPSGSTPHEWLDTRSGACRGHDHRAKRRTIAAPPRCACGVTGSLASWWYRWHRCAHRLSESGAALLLPRPVRAGDTVSFHVLWSQVSLRASGTVRRAQRNRPRGRWWVSSGRSPRAARR